MSKYSPFIIERAVLLESVPMMPVAEKAVATGKIPRLNNMVATPAATPPQASNKLMTSMRAKVPGTEAKLGKKLAKRKPGDIAATPNAAAPMPQAESMVTRGILMENHIIDAILRQKLGNKQALKAVRDVTKEPAVGQDVVRRWMHIKGKHMVSKFPDNHPVHLRTARGSHRSLTAPISEIMNSMVTRGSLREANLAGKIKKAGTDAYGRSMSVNGNLRDGVFATGARRLALIGQEFGQKAKDVADVATKTAGAAAPKVARAVTKGDAFEQFKSVMPSKQRKLTDAE